MADLVRVQELVESARDYLENLDNAPAAFDEASTARLLAQRRMDALAREAERAGDGQLQASTQREFNQLHKLRAEAAEIEKAADDSIRGQVTHLRADATEARAAQLRSAEKYGGTKVTTVRVGSEPDLYREGGEFSFFRDVINARQTPLAQERLLRHEQYAASRMETRDVSTGNLAGLVIPQYLVKDFAPIARAGRPFADQWFKPRFPDEGMTLNVPRGNTATLVGSQTTQNTAIEERDYTVSDIVVPVVTIAGLNDLSRQSIERGVISDEVAMTDLAAAYVAELDRQLTHGTGANNQHYGILSTTNISTITMTSTSAITQIRQVSRAVAEIATNRKLPPTLVVLHPRRWAYWSLATDSQGRPLITPTDVAQNVMGTVENAPLDGIVGRLAGCDVLVDANFSTTLSYDATQSSTTDAVVVTRSSDLFLYEGSPMPRRVRFDETLAGQLTVRLVCWDYSAATAGRYTTSTIVLAGSGLTTPTWT